MLRWFSVLSLVDEGRDGDWATTFLEPAGLVAVRGSSLHGGRRAALELSRKMLRRSIPSVLCVDGPAGPAEVAKTGVLRLGRQAARPIVAVSTASSRSFKVVSRWSEIYIPFPFSRLVVAFGTPIVVPAGSDRLELEALRTRLDWELRTVREMADRSLKSWPVGELLD